MANLKISSLSTEYVKVPVAITLNGNTYNPTGDSLQMAFLPAGVNPVSGDWKTAQWETAGTTYYAKCLVGPGATPTFPLTVGVYFVWIKVTDSPEIPVLKCSTHLVIF